MNFFDRDERGPDFSLSSGVDPTYRTPDHLRVLFIGNSFTEFNGSQPLIVTRFADALRKADPAIKPPQMEMVQIYGATLRQHWNQRHSAAALRICEGNWDDVVLQGHSKSTLSADTRNDLFQYAQKFDQQVKRIGARTVLFMTWADDDKRGDMPRIRQTYEELAEKLGAIVAPVGLAFENARNQYPQIVLTQDYDQKHPTEAGSYLTACVFYATLYGKSPEGAPRWVIDPKDKYVIYLSSADALALQRIAWETVSHYRQPAAATLPATVSATTESSP